MVFIVLSHFQCTNKKKTTHRENVDSLQTVSANTPTRSNDPISPTTITRNHLSTSGNKWVYDKKIDKEGNTVYKASISSPGLLAFGFPYAGGSIATLSIRHKNGESYLYLEVSKGQFNRSFQGGTARIHFDNEPAHNYTFSAAENGRANIIFFDSVQPLIDQLKSAQKTVIDVDFYAQGKRRIEFRTVGLSWNH